mmetsp:Transcript_8483/g.21233  ORF Transcript_8483/g.21233 Transcript_8483/m.21233 type:complete len:270 (+) Transcript_8483:3757-4566(+)
MRQILVSIVVQPQIRRRVRHIWREPNPAHFDSHVLDEFHGVWEIAGLGVSRSVERHSESNHVEILSHTHSEHFASEYGVLLSPVLGHDDPANLLLHELLQHHPRVVHDGCSRIIKRSWNHAGRDQLLVSLGCCFSQGRFSVGDAAITVKHSEPGTAGEQIHDGRDSPRQIRHDPELGVVLVVAVHNVHGGGITLDQRDAQQICRNLLRRRLGCVLRHHPPMLWYFAQPRAVLDVVPVVGQNLKALLCVQRSASNTSVLEKLGTRRRPIL